MKSPYKILGYFTFSIIASILISCNRGPDPIRIGHDSCSFCKMSIADPHFGGEIMTKKGKVYKFDDVHCLLGFIKSNEVNKNDFKEIWIVNYNEPHNFLPIQSANLFRSEDLHSPMNGNIAGIEFKDSLKILINNLKGETITWDALSKEE